MLLPPPQLLGLKSLELLSSPLLQISISNWSPRHFFLLNTVGVAVSTLPSLSGLLVYGLLSPIFQAVPTPPIPEVSMATSFLVHRAKCATEPLLMSLSFLVTLAAFTVTFTLASRHPLSELMVQDSS